MLRPPRQEDLEEELGIFSTTVVDWFSFCREVIYFNIAHLYFIYLHILLLFLYLQVCAYWADKSSKKLGDPALTVEIDEAKIDHRKYNRGRLLKGNWIFGGYERESKKIFIVPVERIERKKHSWHVLMSGLCQERRLFQIVGSPIIVLTVRASNI